MTEVRDGRPLYSAQAIRESVLARFEPVEVGEEGRIRLVESSIEFQALVDMVLNFTESGRAQANALTALEKAHWAVSRAIAESNRKGA